MNKGIIIPIDNNGLNELLIETKETIATGALK